MNDLVRPENLLAVQAPDALANELEVLFAGTKSFGRTVTEPAKAAWMLALRAKGVTLAELQIAVEWWVTSIGGETPEPRALVAFIEEKRVDVEKQQLLRQAAEDARQETEMMSADFRMRHFGTLDVEPEEVRAKVKEIFKTLPEHAATRNLPDIGKGTLRNPEVACATPEEEAERQRKIAALRENRGVSA